MNYEGPAKIDGMQFHGVKLWTEPEGPEIDNMHRVPGMKSWQGFQRFDVIDAPTGWERLRYRDAPLEVELANGTKGRMLPVHITFRISAVESDSVEIDWVGVGPFPGVAA